MNNKAKKIIIISVSAGFLIVLLVMLFPYLPFINREAEDGNDRDEKSNTVDGVDKEFLEECWNSLEDEVVGDWEFPPNSEIPTVQYFTFNEDGSYIHGDRKKPKIYTEGEWEYNKDKNAIKISIKKDNVGWSEILKDDLSTFKGVTDYDYDKKFIVLEVFFFYNPSQEKPLVCNPERFYIDLFNIFLYKKTD